jgi:hypothetical protein
MCLQIQLLKRHHSDLFNPMIAHTYENLPNLRCVILIFKSCIISYVQLSAGALITTNNGPSPMGPFALSGIPDVCSDVNME